MEENKIVTKQELVEHLVSEYEDFLKSCDFEYVRRIFNSAKFDIRPS